MIARIRTAAARLIGLFRNRNLESRIDEELRFHMEMQVEENRKKGMPPQEARNAALRSIGGIGVYPS